MAPTEAIGLSIAKARVQRGWSQQRLATALGFERTTIWRYETGQQVPDAGTVLRVAVLLNAPELLASAQAVCGVCQVRRGKEVSV